MPRASQTRGQSLESETVRVPMTPPGPPRMETPWDSVPLETPEPEQPARHSWSAQPEQSAGPSWSAPPPAAPPEPPTVPPPPPVASPPATTGSSPERSGGFSASRFLSGGISASAALGEATPNSTYLGGRLMFSKDPESSFDPLGNTRFLLYMARQAVVLYLIYCVLWVVFLIVFGILYALTKATFMLELFGFGAFLTSLAFFIAWLVIPIPALLSEWRFLVDDKGAARPVVFDHVYAAFRRRNTPVDSIGVRRLSLPGGVTRDYLELQRGVFTGFISCFEQGNDLYVGWTFWLRMSPLKWIVMRVERLWHEVTQKASDLYVTLRYESAKALREAMHSAAREGVDVAAGQVDPQGQGSLQSVPVATTEILR